MMDWIDLFSRQNHIHFFAQEPGYWRHGLLRHLGIPETWPPDWTMEPRCRFFILLLESFAPPKDLRGLIYQLPAMRHIALNIVHSEFKNQASEFLDDFEDQIQDFVTFHAPNHDRETLTSRRLKHLTQLGIWRFHFHCAQVDRSRLDTAINTHLAKSDLVDARKIAYLRAGQLDPIYELLGPRLHRSLRRRLRDKIRYGSLPQSWEDQLALIYTESLICERALLSAHMLIPEQHPIPSDPDPWLLSLIKRMRFFASLPKEVESKAIQEEPDQLQPFIPHIARTFNFMMSFGSYHPKGKVRHKKRFSSRTLRERVGRLLPPAMFDLAEKEGFDRTVEAELEEPLNILLGVPDDRFSRANLKRSYGLRPSLPHELGESETDYVGPDHLEIPAAWVSDPFRQSIKQRVQAESMILALEPPIWSPPALMVQTIRNYLANASHREPSTRFLALMALYTGMSLNALKKIRLGFPPWMRQIMASGMAELDDECLEIINEERKRPHTYLDPESGSYGYALSHDQIAYYSKTPLDSGRNCLPATFVVAVALPDLLRSALQDWMDSDPEHFLVDPSEPHTLFSKRDLDEWTNLMAETGRMSAENVTPSRIQATFRSLFGGQIEMQAIHLDLVANDFPIQHRAQHFYSSVDLAKLNASYGSAARTIHALLSGDNPPKTNTHVEHECEDKHSPIRGFAGSRIVPEKQMLAQYFSELHASFVAHFEAGIPEPTSWNRMMLFLFRLMQLSTGLRPMRDSLPNWSWVSLSTGWIRISDKDNLHFFESRIIPLSTRLLEWLSWLNRNLPRFLLDMNQTTIWLTSSKRNQMCEEIFIHAADDGMARPMTMNDFLDAESSLTLSVPWTWKANALRHFLLSTLLNERADQSIIDCLTGHKHFGREPFNRFSMMHPEAFATKARKLIDQHIVSPLNIPGPPNWPR